MAKRQILRRSGRTRGRLGDWELGETGIIGFTHPIIFAPTLAANTYYQTFDLIAIAANAGPVGSIGDVEVGPLHFKLDLPNVNTAGYYVIGAGMYRAKWDLPSASYLPNTVDPLVPADVCRDKFWMKGPVYSALFLPASGVLTTPTAFTLRWTFGNFILHEGESLKFVLSIRSSAAVAIFSAMRSTRFKQRRLV